MMSKEDLVTLLRSWRVDGEIAFARALQSAMDTLPLKNRYLAIKFEVADLTVGRWASGLSKPHPRIQEYVVHALLALAEGQSEDRPHVAIRYCSDLTNPNAISSVIASLRIGHDNHVELVTTAHVGFSPVEREMFEMLPELFANLLSDPKYAGKSLSDLVWSANARMGDTFRFELIA